MFDTATYVRRRNELKKARKEWRYHSFRKQ